MIVRKLADGRLFCINQTSHALMAAQFCRAWGNDDVAPPAPVDIVRMAVAQHDNGWYEWECAPKLRADGLVFVGLDVIGGKLTEVNVTSPTGIQQMMRLDGVNYAAPVIDAFEARVAR